MTMKPTFASSSMCIALLAALFSFVGCERKETVLDIEGPDGGGVSVERDIDDGGITVDVDD